MGNKLIENGLALAGALLVLVGVIFAAGSALADETGGGGWRNAATQPATIELTGEARATRAAADDAIESIAEENALDLEIRLNGRMYIFVARAR